MDYSEEPSNTDEQIALVVEQMKVKFPTAVDWNVINDGDNDDEYAEILDENDNRLGTISERQLTRYWNNIE